MKYEIKWNTNKSVEERKLVETDEEKWFALTKTNRKEIDAETKEDAVAIFEKQFIDEFGGNPLHPEYEYENEWIDKRGAVHASFTIHEKGSNFYNGITIYTGKFKL